MRPWHAIALLATLATISWKAAADNADAGRVWASCVEHVPPGATRPVLEEKFPSTGMGGYALPLTIKVVHGKGETVLPQGSHAQDGDAAHAISEAGFAIPDADGGAGPSLETVLGDGKATTTLTVSFVALPSKPGRQQMILPPVPIAVARASGELLTLCTRAHAITVTDPTSSVPDAKPKLNPAPRSQREEWTLAKQLTVGALGGALLAALVTLLVLRQMRKPKPAKPLPPPRPPWDVAMEELFAIRHAGLVTQARFAEHFDRVSDAIRKYLGGRYGFDGLETTTQEMTSILKRVSPPVIELAIILRLLDECDLVKFARLTPTEPDCSDVLASAERIVAVTRPVTTATAAVDAARKP